MVMICLPEEAKRKRDQREFQSIKQNFLYKLWKEKVITIRVEIEKMVFFLQEKELWTLLIYK
jgi:hypothetical protein